jgi:hypothetical protein
MRDEGYSQTYIRLRDKELLKIIASIRRQTMAYVLSELIMGEADKMDLDVLLISKSRMEDEGGRVDLDEIRRSFEPDEIWDMKYLREIVEEAE